MDMQLAGRLLTDYGIYGFAALVLAVLAYRAVTQGVKVSLEVKPKK